MASIPVEKPSVRAEGQLLQALVSHWIHEDNLFWSQVRHLLVIQVAVSASWFALSRSWLGFAIGALGALVSWVMYRLAKLIAVNRDINLAAIAIVSRSVASTETESL